MNFTIFNNIYFNYFSNNKTNNSVDDRFDHLTCEVVPTNWVFSFPLAINLKTTETNKNPNTNNEIPWTITDYHPKYKLITVTIRKSIPELGIYYLFNESIYLSGMWR